MKKGKNPYVYFVHFQNRWQILNYFSVDSFHQEDKILISEEGYHLSRIVLMFHQMYLFENDFGKCILIEMDKIRTTKFFKVMATKFG